jgi:hypothetical protein
MTFSVDAEGPLATPPPIGGVPDFFLGVPIDGGDILTPPLPGPAGPNMPAFGPLPVPGREISALPAFFPPKPAVVPGGLGILPGASLEIDALSFGADMGAQLFFSVDEFALGIPGAPLPPNVTSEGAAGAAEAAADVFAYLGPLVATPPVAVPPGNSAVIDGNGLAPFGGTGSGLFEPNPPGFGVPDAGSNLDGLDLDTTPAQLAGPYFYSLEGAVFDPMEGIAGTGTAGANGFSGAMVLASFPGGAPFVFAPGPALGLDVVGGFGTDDLDALVLFDTDASLTLTPPDFIGFSVKRGSAVIGAPDSAFGVPIAPGDVLTVPAGFGPCPICPAIFIAAEALGLQTLRSGFLMDDELDALDVLPDLDLDLVPDPADNCLTIANGPNQGGFIGIGNQLDSEAVPDGVGDACDSCTYTANPPVAALVFQTTTGGQLDDDADGFGNQCDADYNGAGAAVDGADLALFKFAFGKKRTTLSCNPGATSPCDEYDHNNAVATIDSTDFSAFKALFGKTKKSDGDVMNKCPTCPIAPCAGDACP